MENQLTAGGGCVNCPIANRLETHASLPQLLNDIDARSSEQDIRQQLIQSGSVDVMVAVGPNMFYTVVLPCTLWFLDKRKGKGTVGGSPAAKALLRQDAVLFIDARHIYRQIDRAHREWTPAQIGFIANLVRIYRGEELDFTLAGGEARAKIEEIFGK